MPESKTETTSSGGFIVIEPGQSFDLPFVADAGPVEIEVLAKRAIALGPNVGPTPPPPPPLSTEGGIRVGAIPPGQTAELHKDEQPSGSTGVQVLKFAVRPDQQGQWTCRCTNIVNQTRRCRAIVRFTRLVDVTIVETTLPLRLLNRTFVLLLRALGPRVVLDDELSVVDLSPEARRMLGGTFEPIVFEAQASNFKLDPRSPRVVAYLIPTGAGGHLPGLAVDLNFIPIKGASGVLGSGLEKATATNVRIILSMLLGTGGELGSRQIFPNVDVAVQINSSEAELFNVPTAADELVETFLEALFDALGGDLDATVRNKVREKIEDRLRRPEVLHPAGAFITEALQQLAERGNVFHDLVVDNGNWKVLHLERDRPGTQGKAPPSGVVAPVREPPPPGSVGIGPGGTVVTPTGPGGGPGGTVVGPGSNT